MSDLKDQQRIAAKIIVRAFLIVSVAFLCLAVFAHIADHRNKLNVHLPFDTEIDLFFLYGRLTKYVFSNIIKPYVMLQYAFIKREGTR